MSAPFEPPIQSVSLPGTAGRIGPAFEDFVVEELAAFEPSGSGSHLFARLEKRGWTTPDAVRAVARAAGVAERDVGSAGMKDKRGVTRQWLSLPATCRAPDAWALPDGLEVLEVTLHDRKLRTGQLRGNRFGIQLVDVVPDALAKAREICARLLERGLPNYFGAQRFGHAGNNLPRALEWLGGRRGPAKRQRFYRKLYPSVVQSEVFNRYAAMRLELGADQLLEGEVVRLDGSNSVFVVEQPEREAPRLASGDIHLTGPMVGPKMRAATGRPHELELQAQQGSGLGEAQLEALARSVAGTRRDLLVRVEGLSVEATDQGLRLSFTLPAGSYATQLVRELTRGPWLGGGD